MHSSRPFPRPVFNLNFMLVTGLLAVIFVAVHICLFCIELSVWSKYSSSLETTITSPVMTAKFEKILPFDEFPAPNATNLIHFRRKMGLVGYELWQCFEFTTDNDFEEYRNTVLSDPRGVTTERVDTFEYPIKLPRAFEKLMAVDVQTNSTRLSIHNTQFQWLFLPAHRRVIFLDHD